MSKVIRISDKYLEVLEHFRQVNIERLSSEGEDYLCERYREMEIPELVEHAISSADFWDTSLFEKTGYFS